MWILIPQDFVAVILIFKIVTVPQSGLTLFAEMVKLPGNRVICSL